jgi:glycolate oxidase
MFSAIKDIEGKYHIPTATFGHAGDGNLHVHFLVSSGEQEAVLPSAVETLFRRTTELGGTLSGEHGIGLTKARYLSLEIMTEELRLMKAIKQLIDPKGIMNPGKKIV